MRYDIQFFKQFAENKSGKCLSDSYVNCRTKLQWQCESGHVWAAQPRKIKEGSWCPECCWDKQRINTANDAFFSNDNEFSFYIAGFLAADGWKTKKAGGAYKIGLQLAAKDIEILTKIKNIINAAAPLKYRERIDRGKLLKSYYIKTNM